MKSVLYELQHLYHSVLVMCIGHQVIWAGGFGFGFQSTGRMNFVRNMQSTEATMSL